jgi:amino-acid N-acetyltransferase
MVDHKNSQNLANMAIESASQANLPAILTLLTESWLPQEGVSEHLSNALVARVGRQVVGCAALEFYGSAALLRSVAVDRSYRGQGLGQRLTEAALRLAQENGVTRVYLLTETAGQFFSKFGFQPIDRSHVPPAVRGSIEFTSLCPVSALAMELDLESVEPDN